MPFDRAEFRAALLAAHAQAATPAHIPEPDPSIEDPAERERLQREALARMLAHRNLAIRDCAKRHGAHLVAMAIGVQWRPSMADPEDGGAELVKQAQALIEQGDADHLVDAAALLLIVAYQHLVKE